MKKLLFLTLILFSLSCSEDEVFGDLEHNKYYCEHEYENGKNDGRSAILIYLQETGQIGNATIELSRVFDIEDSLRNTK